MGKWSKYVGQYIRGKAEGLGHYTYSNGDYYKGKSSTIKRNGEGTYFYTDGKNKKVYGKMVNLCMHRK